MATHLSNQGDTHRSSHRAIHRNRVFRLSSRAAMGRSVHMPHNRLLDIRLSSQVAMGRKGRRLAALVPPRVHRRRRAR